MSTDVDLLRLALAHHKYFVPPSYSNQLLSNHYLKMFEVMRRSFPC